jgi:flagellar protein FlgJ
MSTISALPFPAQATSPQAALPDASRAKDKAAAAKVAKEYEGVFLQEMLGHMFKGLSTDGLFGGGHSEEIYRSLLLKEYANGLSDRGGLGISKALQSEIMRLQEASK